tara:strand:- start:2021 stop:2224 length:204 start_codon:yes stop_codon:yes gene_type:complete
MKSVEKFEVKSVVTYLESQLSNVRNEYKDELISVGEFVHYEMFIIGCLENLSLGAKKYEFTDLEGGE